jgi:hypothetical protein
MPAQMQLVLDDDRHIRFTNPWKWGLAIAFVGLLVWLFVPLNLTKGFKYWVVLGGAAFTVFVGLAAFLYRDELVLDLVTRAYTLRRGYWPAVREQTRSMNDFRALLLGAELRRNPRGGQYPTWVISLQCSGVQPDLAVLELRSESQAYGKIESWSRKLGLPAFEIVDGREQPLEFKPVARQQPAELGSMQIPMLPSGSRLAFLGAAPTRTIVLPPLGFGLGVLILALFPAITLWMGFAGYNEAIHHIPPRSTSFATGVVCFGILMVVALFFAIFGRTAVREQDDMILVGNSAFGWNYNVKSFAKRDIEEVEIKPTTLSSGAPVFTLSGMRVIGKRPRARAELFVHSRNQVVRIGQGLSSQDLQWLHQALLCLAQT